MNPCLLGVWSPTSVTLTDFPDLNPRVSASVEDSAVTVQGHGRASPIRGDSETGLVLSSAFSGRPRMHEATAWLGTGASRGCFVV